MADELGVALRRLGTTGGASLRVCFGHDGPETLDLALERLRASNEGVLDV